MSADPDTPAEAPVPGDSVALAMQTSYFWANMEPTGLEYNSPSEAFEVLRESKGLVERRKLD